MRAGREAVVHIGHKKTGTSFIQHHFHRAADALRALGVLYPLREANHSFALSGLFRRHTAVRAPSPLDGYVAERNAGLLAFERSLGGDDWQTLLLSAEALAGFSIAELTELRGVLVRHVDRVRIVFVIRDPVDWAVSVAQQYLRSRSDIDAVLSQPEPVRWRAIIGRMRHVFGAGAVEVLAYEELAAERDAFAARFAHAAGLPLVIAPLLRGERETVNESLSMEAALMLGRLNVRVPEAIDGARNPARSGSEAGIFAGLPGQRFDLPDNARRLAYAESRDDVAFVGRQFGITRYDYPPERLAASRYTEQVSSEFLDALADRLYAFNAEATASRLLLDSQRLRDRGETKRADALLRQAGVRFPEDRRVARATAHRARG
ncbi:hypothetical protein [Sphingomonas sp. TZW2008]|uniref:hypothetical protein n=1 Tax=Sphingomonas sp. TZW2008 TaxID=1917973 RepID=UPI000A26C11A|nr:hypothetical protein [Sphingomonas sp. TZW2008]